MRQIFVDVDGVLADMDTYYESLFPHKIDRGDTSSDKIFWRNIGNYVQDGGRFYYELPLFDDAKELWEGVKKFCPNPIMLTGGGDKKYARTTEDKLAWRDKYFPGAEMIVCLSREKCLHGKAGDILIDDWLKYRHLWQGMGGLFLHHSTAKNSLEVLKYFYFHFGESKESEL